MNAPTDHNDAPAERKPSELDAAYARASHADGSRPSPSTRASILANAQRVAPAAAANESWWNWRAAAGFTGVAFAGVLALWLYLGNPEPVPQSVSLPTPPLQPLAPAPSSAATADVATAAATAAPVAPAADAAQSASRADFQLEQVVETRARKAAAPSAAMEAAPAPAPAASIAGAAPRLLAANQAMRAERTATTRMGAPPADALLQRWFPQALDSDTDGLQYWFLLGRDGEVLRSGQRAWTELPALQRWLEGADAGPRIARMESAHFMNRRGRDVELAYAWAASD